MSDLASRYRKIAAEVLEAEEETARREGEEHDSRPRAPAPEEAIAAAEAARGRRLAPPYRTLLEVFDGWDHFAWGVSLFGSNELAGEEYDDATEVFGYGDDPLPPELAAGLVIGASEDNATRIILLESGEVVDWLYEEEERFASLEAYLASRRTTLLEMADAAAAMRRLVEAQWDPKTRARADRALEKELRAVLAAARKSTAGRSSRTKRKKPARPPKPVAVRDLVLRKKKEVVAEVGLGLVLYLGAAPTRDEVVATFRAFRARFPVPGALVWRPASSMAFFSKRSESADAEELFDALRVDDEGSFGLRAAVEPARAKKGRKETYFLNVRSVPPQEPEDDEEQEGDGSGRPSRPVPQASFVEVFVPADEDPGALEALCHDLADLLPIRSGHGGLFAGVWDSEAAPDPYDTVFSWCRRCFGIDVAYVDGWLGAALTRLRGAGWLTVLGRPFARVLDAAGALRLSRKVARHDGKLAVVLRVGEEPSPWDASRGEVPPAIVEVARAIEPLTLSSYGKSGMFSAGGVYFSTFTSELPGGFVDHHATLAHLRRFTHPEGLFGPTPREEAEALLEALCKASKTDLYRKWRKPTRRDDDRSFGALMRALFSASTGLTTTPLGTRALELAARYPDWSPPQVYNNLLYSYFLSERTDDALAVMPVALRTARENPPTYHNAACILVRAGKLKEALACVKLAKASGYELLDRMRTDTDLAPLWKKREWKAIFG